MKQRDILKTTKPIDSRAIPPKYDLPHSVAFFFHDELASLVVDLERSDSLLVNVSLESESEREEVLQLQGEELWKWLKEKEREDVIFDLTYRQLTAAVITDAAHFLCESLLACGKGKTTVAYSLLRKPLKENLLLLEWMLAKPDDFMTKFYGEKPEDYVLNGLPKGKRLEIMRDCTSMLDMKGIDEEWMWTIRYDKNLVNSLETLWQKATHLVTTMKAIKTEPGNLNFVFSSSSAVDEQLSHYYSIVPLVLYYFVNVAEEVISQFTQRDEETRSIQHLLRNLAFIRYSEEASFTKSNQDENSSLWDDLKDISFPCLTCDNQFQITKSEVDKLWLTSCVECPECGEMSNIWDILVNESGKNNGI